MTKIDLTLILVSTKKLNSKTPITSLDLLEDAHPAVNQAIYHPKFFVYFQVDKKGVVKLTRQGSLRITELRAVYGD